MPAQNGPDSRFSTRVSSAAPSTSSGYRRPVDGALPVVPPRQLRCRRLGSDWPLSPLSVDTGPYQDQFRAAAVCRRRLHGPHPAVRADDSHTPWRGNVSAMLPAKVGLAVDRYLKTMDQALPGRIDGFYVVGSVALGDFQPGRSDVDFVAVVTQPLKAGELQQLGSLQRRLYFQSLVEAIPHPRWPLVCNGVFVLLEDLKRPPLQVTAVASHVAGKFTPGGGFDVNPVTWLNLRRFGIPVRGPEPADLDVYHSDAELRAWTLRNLDSYWRRWAGNIKGSGLTAAKALLLRYVAWGVQGTSRMHYTIATGDLASKTRATDYALDVFPDWRPLLEEVRAYWLGTARRSGYTSPLRRRRDMAEFVSCVIESATATS